MGAYQVFVFVIYIGVLQCDLYQSAPAKRPTTTVQLRFPFSYMDGYSVPYSSFTNNKQRTPNPGRNRPKAVTISIPTATKSGRTNIKIDTRKLPKHTPYHNCKSKVNDTTHVNVLVEIKNYLDNQGNNSKNNSSSESTAQTSAHKYKTKNVIESKSSTKSHSKIHDKEVIVTVDVKQIGENNVNKNKINSPVPNSQIEATENGCKSAIETEQSPGTGVTSSCITAPEDITTTEKDNVIIVNSNSVATDKDVTISKDDAVASSEIIINEQGTNARSSSEAISKNNEDGAASKGITTANEDATVIETLGIDSDEFMPDNQIAVVHNVVDVESTSVAIIKDDEAGATSSSVAKDTTVTELTSTEPNNQGAVVNIATDQVASAKSSSEATTKHGDTTVVSSSVAESKVENSVPESVINKHDVTGTDSNTATSVKDLTTSKTDSWPVSKDGEAVDESSYISSSSGSSSAASTSEEDYKTIGEVDNCTTESCTETGSVVSNLAKIDDDAKNGFDSLGGLPSIVSDSDKSLNNGDDKYS